MSEHERDGFRVGRRWDFAAITGIKLHVTDSDGLPVRRNVLVI